MINNTHNICLLKGTLVFLILAYSLNFSYSQLNIKAGYIGMDGQFEATNALFQDYNTNNSLDKTFKNLGYLQGIDIGLRYRINNLGLEAGWYNMQSSKIEALGDGVNENWRISNSQFYLGLENYFGHLGFGASIGYNNIKYRRKIESSRDRSTKQSDNFLSTKFCLIITASSGKTGISIKPFYQPQWNSHNITDFNHTLNGTKPEGLSDYLKGFGISIALYNGPQS